MGFGVIGICIIITKPTYSTGSYNVHYKILKHHCSCTARSAFFVERVVNIWNSLPYDIIDFSSLPAFKRSIEMTDLSRFLSFPEFA